MAKEPLNTTPADTPKLNCWEHKKCGRQPGGHKVADLGICPASVDQALNGAHGGKNGGRSCWVIVGSLCGGKIQGTYAQKLNNCWRCDFMNRVKKEEEPALFGFSHTRLGMERALEKHAGAAPPAAAANQAAVRNRA
jgi:hypothetical protein